LKNSNVESLNWNGNWRLRDGKLETARESIERAKLLEVVAAERAQLINEKDKQLADVREATTKYYFRIQELERTLAEIGQK
jgi:hypothetical protein